MEKSGIVPLNTDFLAFFFESVCLLVVRKDGAFCNWFTQILGAAMELLILDRLQDE